MSEPTVRAEALQERLEGCWANGMPDPALSWINGRCDSRSIRPGEVFVALSGTRTDGHDHLEDARQNGASFAVVRRPVPSSSLLQLVVAEPVLALREMANLALEAHRNAGHKLIALTGSVGKTTTRELLRLGLVPEGGAHASRGNENNEIGVPLTLLSWPQNHRYCILEVGIRKRGDMDYLASLLSADVGIVTAIGPGHLENLDSVESVWAEKSKLFKQVLPGGRLILPDPVKRAFSADPLFKDPRWTVVSGALDATDALAESVIASVRLVSGILTLHLDRWNLDVPLSRCSMALAWCTLLALLAINELGINPREAGPRLAAYEGFSGRMERREHPSGLLLLLDHYNANPSSMREALNWLLREKECRSKEHSFAILGDMLELGPDSSRYHEALGRQAAEQGIERIWYRGQEKEAFIRGFIRGGGDPQNISSAEEFSSDLAGGRGPSGRDILLVKGSRGMKLEEVVAPLLEGA